MFESFPRRRLVASVLAVSLLGGGVEAAEAAALPPGTPAGVHKAQLDRTTVAVVGASVLLIAGFSVLVASWQKDDTAETVLTGGGPSGSLPNNSVTSTATTATH